jgi:hypothetical protein
MNAKVLKESWGIGLLCVLFSSGAAWGANPEPLPLRITPAEGAQVTSGQSLTLHVDTDVSVENIEVTVFNYGEKQVKFGPPPLDFTLNTSWHAAGEYVVGVDGYSYDAATGTVWQSSTYHSLFAIPDPSEVPTRLDVESLILLDAPAAGEPADSEKLFTQAYYADGRDRNVTLGALGTTYTSSDPSIATVDGDGLITAVSSGSAFIRTEYRGVRAWTRVSVNDGRAALTDYTDQVSLNAGGFRVDPETGLFVQQVSFTNETGWPIPEPIHIVVTGLPDGIEMPENRNRSRQVQPVGSPIVHVELPLDVSVLRPGEMATATLRFKNDDRLPITYTPRLVGGALP